MVESVKLLYKDYKRIYFPSLFYYRSGLSLPGGDNIIKVTIGESQSLLTRKNGCKNCFEVYEETIEINKFKELEEIFKDEIKETEE